MTNLALKEVADSIGYYEMIKMYSKGDVNLNMDVTKTVFSETIDDLELSIRSYNGLMRDDAKSVGDVIDRLSTGRLYGLRNIGLKSILEIQRKVINFCYDSYSSEQKLEQIDRLRRENKNAFVGTN